jgi:hypothetical protein
MEDGEINPPLQRQGEDAGLKPGATRAKRGEVLRATKSVALRMTILFGWSDDDASSRREERSLDSLRSLGMTTVDPVVTYGRNG